MLFAQKSHPLITQAVCAHSKVFEENADNNVKNDRYFGNTRMNSIDTQTSIPVSSTIIETAAPRRRESSDQKMAVESTYEKTKLRETSVSFSFYGSRNERVAIVIKDKETGKVIHEIPSENVQELHAWLEERGYKIVDEKV
jgi:uncharacterized FlaG/YvyC family protein